MPKRKLAGLAFGVIAVAVASRSANLMALAGPKTEGWGGKRRTLQP
jgi:hypothetical protein